MKQVTTARRAAALLCLLIVVPSLAPAGDDPDTRAEELYDLGKNALGAGRYGQAVQFLEHAAAVGAEEIELYYWLGLAYWSREQGDRAITAYRRAVDLDAPEDSPWSLYALEMLAEVYTRTGRLEESRAVYRRALARERRPEWIRTIKNQLAELDLTEGLYHPDRHTVYNERGEIIGGVGPDRMRTNRNFEIARHTTDPEKEEKYYRLAIDTDPGMNQPYFNLGLALVHQGRHREAIPWFEESDAIWKADTETNPDRTDKTDAHAFLALCHLELGNLDSAKHHSRRALAVGGTDFWTLLYAQRVKIASGAAREALLVLEALAEENPEHAETLHALSLAYASTGRKNRARETFVAAIDSIPEDHPWMGRLRGEWEGDCPQRGLSPLPPRGPRPGTLD